MNIFIFINAAVPSGVLRILAVCDELPDKVELMSVTDNGAQGSDRFYVFLKVADQETAREIRRKSQ